MLLGDDGPNGWGIKYAREFDMTNDSKLFPPRPKWEADGYHPDEYSRWLKGDWRPIAELWAELGVNPLPAGERCCAQPPYDTLPIPRADVPTGIILSRAADAWMREERVEDVALPLYEGRMVSLFDFSEKGWVSGKGRKAEWRVIPWQSKGLEPQYLMAVGAYAGSESSGRPKLGFLAVGSGTNMRSMYCSILPDLPSGNSVATLRVDGGTQRLLGLLQRMVTFVFDYVIRMKLTGVNLNYFVIDEAPLSEKSGSSPLIQACTSLSFPSQLFSPEWIRITRGDPRTSPWRRWWAVTPHERVRERAAVDAVALAEASLSEDDGLHLLRDCDWCGPISRPLDPKGFWRVEKDKDPELRHTVLTLVAFHDLQEKIRACGGDRDKGSEAFLAQNDGEGWMLPETLRLADYGLGHDERAKEPQPVASRLGPRFYDWQLAQSAEESWRECHLHARNLLGEAGYRQLLDEIEAEKRGERSAARSVFAPASSRVEKQGKLFE